MVSTLQLQLQLQLHYTTVIPLHYSTLHYTTATTTATTTLHQTRLHYTRLHYRAQHCSTLHYTTLHYTTIIPPHQQLPLQLRYTNYSTLQLQTPRHFDNNYSCTTHHIQQLWVRWPLQSLQPLQKTTPITCRSISGFALPPMHHNNSSLL